MSGKKKTVARATNTNDRHVDDEGGPDISKNHDTTQSTYQQIVLREALCLAKERHFFVAACHSILRSGDCSCGKSQCSNPGKHPATIHGHKDATTVAEKIIAMFKNGPKNISIRTGKVSGIVVLDIDPRNGGEESFKKLIEEYGELPPTLTVNTGGGGKHFYFRYPKDAEYIKGIPLVNWPGIDIKGDNGAVIAPPSRHVSGGTYQWVDRDAELAELPSWLKKIIGSTTLNHRSGQSNQDQIPEGKRHDALKKRAADLRQLGHEEAFIYEALCEFSKKFCEGEVGKKEIHDLAKYFGSKPVTEKIWNPNDKVVIELVSCSGKSFLEPVEPKLIRLIKKEEAAIFKNAPPNTDKETIKSAIYEMKCQMILGYIMKVGDLIHAEGNRFFFLNKRLSKLFDLELPLWSAWLYCLGKEVLKSVEQTELTREMIIAARLKDPVQVYRFAHWDTEKRILYVSQFNGRVLRLDGSSIESIRNGEEVLFEENPDWEPFEPAEIEDSIEDPYERLTVAFPRWDGHDEEMSLILHCWIISLFFAELCPSKPILLLHGDKGSGKSTLLRVILKYLFGQYAEVVGVPDKQDAFNVLASRAHIVALDNMDEAYLWLQDKLARISTGAKEVVRKLFTTNEEQTITFRCFIAITSRTPDTLKRGDVADRCVTLPLQRIFDHDDHAGYEIERDMFARIAKDRQVFWKHLLGHVNAVVKALREDDLPSHSDLRLADWEALSRVVARIDGKEGLWERAKDLIKRNQKILIIDDDPLSDALKSALVLDKIRRGPDNTYTSGDLFKLLIGMYEEYGLKPDPCFKSMRSFSKKISGMYSELADEIGIRKERGTKRAEQHRNIYYFDPEVELDPDSGRMFRKPQGGAGRNSL